MGARRYLAGKTLQAVGTLAFVLAVNFFMFRIMGDPVKLLARTKLHLSPAQQLEQLKEFGLDKPKWEQFFLYVGDTVSGRLGRSFISGRTVTSEITHRLWPTILLVGTATLLSTVFGILIGIYGGWRRGSFFDRGTLFGSLVLYSAPEGWIGMELIILFTGALGLFPAFGYSSNDVSGGIAHVTDVMNHMFLPMLTLTLGYIGEYTVIMRSSLLEIIGEEYILTARAKGLRDKRVLWDHAVRNALLPTLTLVFYSFGFVLGGAVITEAIFSWPGLGLYTYQAIGNLDFPVLQGIFLLLSGAVIIFNLAADVLYGYLDPRIREA